MFNRKYLLSINTILILIGLFACVTSIFFTFSKGFNKTDGNVTLLFLGLYTVHMGYKNK